VGLELNLSLSEELPGLQSLAEWNARYERKFGHIFIICASGKSAASMLEAVKARYPKPNP